MTPQLNNVFQIAYATSDVEEVAALVRNRFGTGPFTIIDPPGPWGRGQILQLWNLRRKAAE